MSDYDTLSPAEAALKDLKEVMIKHNIVIGSHNSIEYDNVPFVAAPTFVIKCEGWRMSPDNMKIEEL